MAETEVRQRAALYYRLGFAKDDAVRRISANIDWEFECGGARPTEFDDGRLQTLVDETYARRPAR